MWKAYSKYLNFNISSEDAIDLAVDDVIDEIKCRLNHDPYEFIAMGKLEQLADVLVLSGEYDEEYIDSVINLIIEFNDYESIVEEDIRELFDYAKSHLTPASG